MAHEAVLVGTGSLAFFNVYLCALKVKVLISGKTNACSDRVIEKGDRRDIEIRTEKRKVNH